MRKYIIIAVLMALTLITTACSATQEVAIDPQAYADLQAQVEQLNNDIADMQEQLSEKDQVIAENEQELTVKDDTILELQTELDDCAAKQAESEADEPVNETGDEVITEETPAEPPVQETTQPEPEVEQKPEPEVEQKPEPEPEKSATTTNQTLFEGVPINITNWDTTAVSIGRVTGNAQLSAFKDVNGNSLATIATADMQKVVDKTGVTDNALLAELFNDFRNTGSGNTSTATDSNITGDDVTDALYLINAERKANGLNVLTIESSMNVLAQTRAVEIRQDWGHTRPDGTTVMDEFYYYEIITSGAETAEEAITNFINSSQHYDIILEDSITVAGIGTSGNRWCILFQ